MTEVIWGETPKKRQKREEKYTTPVVTLAAIEKVGAGRKISFNKAAQELLGVNGEDHVLFGFTGDGTRVFIKKHSGEKSLQLTKTCTLSDKRTYEQIIKIFSFNLEQENELDLLPVEGQGYFELLPISDLTKTISESQKESENLEFNTLELGEITEKVENLPDDEEEMATMPAPEEKLPLYERIHGKKTPVQETEITGEEPSVNEPSMDAPMDEVVEEVTESQENTSEEEDVW